MAVIDGDMAKHLACCDAALDISACLSDRLGIARSLLLKSRNRLLPGAQALELLHESLEIFRSENDTEGIAKAFSDMGTKASGEPDVARRIAWIEEGLQRHRQRGDYRNIALTIGELGYALQHGGADAESVRPLFEEMLARSAPLKDPNIRGKALFLLGHTEMADRNYVAARRCYAEGLELVRRQGAKTGLALFLISLAEAERRLGQLQSARAFTEEALALYRELNDASGAEGALQLLTKIAAPAEPM